MLDPRHPRTPHVLAANRLQEAIRVRLQDWEASGPPPTLGATAQADVLERLADLHALNRERFGNAAGIGATLAALTAAVEQGDLAASWQAFFRLAEQPGDNFGTWAI